MPPCNTLVSSATVPEKARKGSARRSMSASLACSNRVATRTPL